MNTSNEAPKIYHSFEEFQSKFYPVWLKSQEFQRAEESFGRDLARYSLQKQSQSAPNDPPLSPVKTA